MRSPLTKFCQIKNRDLVRLLLLIASAWALIQVYLFFQPIVIIFTCAGILAFLLNYPTTWLERYIARPIAATGIFLLGVLVLLGFIATITFAIVAQGPAFLARVADLFNVLNHLAESMESFFETRNIPLQISGFEESLQQQVLETFGQIFTFIQDLLGNIAGLVIMLVISFFMLLDAGNFWKNLSAVIPQPLRDRLILSIEKNFLGFFQGRLLLSIFLILSSFLVFVILQVPQPLLMALIAGVFDLVPGIGAALGIILISVILIPHSLWLAGQVFVICLILQQIEENIIMPRLMQQSLHMSPVIIFLALLTGHHIAGLFGLFLSIPATGVVLGIVSPKSNLTL